MLSCHHSISSLLEGLWCFHGCTGTILSCYLVRQLSFHWSREVWLIPAASAQCPVHDTGLNFIRHAVTRLQNFCVWEFKTRIVKWTFPRPCLKKSKNNKITRWSSATKKEQERAVLEFLCNLVVALIKSRNAIHTCDVFTKDNCISVVLVMFHSEMSRELKKNTG